jgi:hypothetical protein
MLLLKRLLARWVHEGQINYDEDGYNESKYPTPQTPPRLRGRGSGKSGNNIGSSEDFKNPLNITLYNAVGGRIIKFHSYDYDTDKSYETTYVVDSQENFEEALGKFITMEALKHNG